MPIVQRFAQVFGAVYVLVGIVGFIPPLLTGGSLPGVIGPFSGLLLGLFAVNWVHNLAHLSLGVAGLAVHRSFAASKAYALALGVSHAGLLLLGFLSGSVATLGGLFPLNGVDNALHVLVTLAGFAIYFTARRPEGDEEAGAPARA